MYRTFVNELFETYVLKQLSRTSLTFRTFFFSKTSSFFLLFFFVKSVMKSGDAVIVITATIVVIWYSKEGILVLFIDNMSIRLVIMELQEVKTSRFLFV